MPLDITQKRVAEVSDIPVKDADGTVLRDEKNEPVTATVFGPGTKIWQVANAKKERAKLKRTREAKGKWEAAVDDTDEDTITFLCTITKSFNGLSYPGAQGDAATVKAVYSDPLLGYIRDHMVDDTSNWENFMKASMTLASSMPASLPG